MLERFPSKGYLVSRLKSSKQSRSPHDSRPRCPKWPQPNMLPPPSCSTGNQPVRRSRSQYTNYSLTGLLLFVSRTKVQKFPVPSWPPPLSLSCLGGASQHETNQAGQRLSSQMTFQSQLDGIYPPHPYQENLHSLPNAPH